MPFVRDGEILALTTTKPWNIISLETGDTVKEGPGLDTFWSGSSQFVPFRDGWLGVVHRHETRFQRDGFWVCRDYTHAFLQMDQDLNPTNLSRPFRFFGEGVEFCSGIDWHGDDLVPLLRRPRPIRILTLGWFKRFREVFSNLRGNRNL